MIDASCRETAAAVVGILRGYPYARLEVGVRAELALCETLHALILVGAENPVLSAAMITLPHRIRGDVVIDREKIVRDTVEAYLDPEGESRRARALDRIPAGKLALILKEFDILQDMIHAMPYDIDLTDADWFKVSRDTLFRAEAPTLTERTTKEDGTPDFDEYRHLLKDLAEQGLMRVDGGAMTLTQAGSAIKFSDVSRFIDHLRTHASRRRRADDTVSADVRRYRSGDGYHALHVHRTLRNLVRRRRGVDQVTGGDLRVKDVSMNKDFQLVLALDHSWSMGRSRKLHYAKDAAAGLVFATMRNRDPLALIAFSDTAAVLSPPSKRYGALLEKIGRLRPENGTNIADALAKARSIFSRGSPGAIRHVIIISDGVATGAGGGVTRKTLEDAIRREIATMRKRGVTISVICIRDELEETDSAPARKIAALGRGTFSLVNASELMNRTLDDYTALERA